MKNKIIFTFLLLINIGMAQVPIDKIDSLMQKEPKFILMNIRSTNCIYCLMQNKKIQKDKTLIHRLNTEVYYTGWAVETQPDFIFNHTLFKNSSVESTNENRFLTQFLKDRKRRFAFPIWLIFDRNYTPIYRYFGLLSNKELNRILNLLQQ